MMEFTIRVEVERESGKFASRDDIGEALVEAVQEADLSSLGVDGDSIYNIIEAEVI